MTLVAGIDSSTQSCKVVIRDAETGDLVRQGVARHPAGTEVDPEHWWTALHAAVERAGGLDDVQAIAVAGQQHGLVSLDVDGQVVRPALLWNDTRSAQAAADLVAELGGGDVAAGARTWCEAVGSVPVASFTVTKLRWLADHEPESAARTAAVALPHDWLTWRLSGAASLETLVTDRSDASGTGYFDASRDAYRHDLLALALRRSPDEVSAIVLPRVLRPDESAGRGDAGAGLGHLLLGPGCGDNAGAALGLSVSLGETLMSLGTSGVVASVATRPPADPSGAVAGFADATGHFLPLACTLNAARVLDAACAVLGVNHQGLSELALAAKPGAAGLVHVPYLEGERTPNLPQATGSLSGMTLTSMTRENLARAVVEGLLCHMAWAVDAMAAQGASADRVILVGGGARSEAVRTIAPSILGVPVDVPEAGEDVADGAARQAAWVLSGAAEPPTWVYRSVDTYEGEPMPELSDRFRMAVDRVVAEQEP